MISLSAIVSQFLCLLQGGVVKIYFSLIWFVAAQCLKSFSNFISFIFFFMLQMKWTFWKSFLYMCPAATMSQCWWKTTGVQSCRWDSTPPWLYPFKNSSLMGKVLWHWCFLNLWDSVSWRLCALKFYGHVIYWQSKHSPRCIHIKSEPLLETLNSQCLCVCLCVCECVAFQKNLVCCFSYRVLRKTNAALSLCWASADTSHYSYGSVPPPSLWLEPSNDTMSEFTFLHLFFCLRIFFS